MNNREAMQEEFEAWWYGLQLPENMKAAFFMVWQAALASQAQQESPLELLQQSKDNFERSFGNSGDSDWIYSDLKELFSVYIPPAPEGESK